MPTVLIIEDHADSREMMGRIFEQEGYVTLVAESGAVALDLLASVASEPCVIILDLAMPGMTGLDFMEELTGRGLLERFPVIVLTAQGRRVRVPQAKALLTKPPNHDDLIALVRHYAGPPGA